MAIRRPTNYDANSDIIADLADMADSIEEELEEKVDKAEGKGLSTNDYTTAEKQKLAGIEAQANKTVVDSSLSSSSTNPVQNKKVYEALAEKQEQIDALVEENSTLKKQQLKGQASGSSIQLTDSAEGLEIENVTLKGTMSQETREGYNLLKFDKLVNDQKTYTIGGITATLDDDCNLTFNGTQTSSWIIFYNQNITSQLKNGTTYTLWCENYSKNLYSESAYGQIRCVNKSTSAQTHIVLNQHKITFTADTDQFNYIFLVQMAYNNLTLSNEKNRFMIYEGIEEKTFEKYGATPSIEYESQVHGVTGTCNINLKNNDLTLQQNAPLSLGNIKLYDGDKIQISFINKAGYKKVTGASIVKTMQTSILWRIGVTQMFEDSTVFWSISKDARQTSDKIVLCSHLSTVRNVYGQEKIGIEVWTGTGEIGVRVPNEIASTLAEFNSWIINNNVKFAYALAEPITTPITDTTLLSQLETLINMKTYKQITNIEATGSDLAPVLEFQYSKDLQTVIDSINARLELVEN